MAVVDAAVTHELGLKSGVWKVDHYHSSVLFSIRHLGLAKVRGRFDAFEADLVVGSSLAETHVEANIDLGTINTNNADRDAHLRSTDFFNTDQHPVMRFVSTGVSSKKGDWVVDGEVTLNGRTRPLSLLVEFNGIQEFPGRNVRHAGFSATGSIKRSEFGIDFGMLPIGIDQLALGDEVKIELDLEFVEPAD